jgi:phospholipase C
MQQQVFGRKKSRLKIALGVSLVALSVFGMAPAGDAAGSSKSSDPADSIKTESPIKHVIILIGENRGLDHTFGVYKPKGKGQTISNLLSKGIVNADGTPGPNFALAQQYAVAPQPSYYIGAPNGAKTPYSAANLMPQPNTNGAPSAQSDTAPPFKTVAEVGAVENDIDVDDLFRLTTGATGLPTGVLDTRVPGAGNLPNGPFLLQGPNLSDDDYTGDMTHRYYQAFQQQDCSIANATKDNPTGCLNDLFPFVMATYSATNQSAGNEMGFLNAEQEQASLHKSLADRFTLSDNFHQSFLGGTGANHFMLGTGDAAFWSDGNGNPITPPSNIANPNPKPGTVNQYIADNNFSNCSDVFQPGVGPIVSYLESLPYSAQPNCESRHYYMLDNTNPGFLPNGALAHGSTIPPSSVRTIGDALNEKKISWAYYGGAYNDAVALSDKAVAANPNNPDLTAAALADPAHALGVAYCQICNPFEYATSIMSDPAVRTAHIKDTDDLLTAIANNTLPSVSFGKPDGLLDGHPQSSKIDLFEAYVENILEALDDNPRLKAETAVLITYDEAGGYYDSGFVQPIDFFGDGPRIPLLVVSSYSTGGKVVHTYDDHVSILKFIERNWGLKPLTDRSRDNLPNPKERHDNAYVPANMPAIGDLFDMFDFGHSEDQPYGRGHHQHDQNKGRQAHNDDHGHNSHNDDHGHNSHNDDHGREAHNDHGGWDFD